MPTIAALIQRNIEFKDDYALVRDIWGWLKYLARRPWIQEAVLISAILIFKTGL